MILSLHSVIGIGFLASAILFSFLYAIYMLIFKAQGSFIYSFIILLLILLCMFSILGRDEEEEEEEEADPD